VSVPLILRGVVLQREILMTRKSSRKLRRGTAGRRAAAGRSPAGPAATRRSRRKWAEAELLNGVEPKMVSGEVDWGPPVGKEAR
jgi:hypothetical protein